MSLQAIKFDKEKVTLEILDQLLLPYSTEYISIKSIEDAFQAIKLMQVRGAPAIAIVGALAVVVELNGASTTTTADLNKSIDYLISSRPTAVNLSNALNDIKQLVTGEVVTAATYKSILDYAVALFEDDLKNNYLIGDNGVGYIRKVLKEQNFKGPFSIITVCNTGSLATSGHGTALGIIRSAYQQLSKGTDDFHLEHVYPLETRPYNQGARLTSYELDYEKIPFTLICDNMVSSLVHTLNGSGKNVKQSNAPVKFIIVGADRVVANGDTANKIGTFQLATIASHFNSRFAEPSKHIKFIVAAPKTTIDTQTQTGAGIVIEERPPQELTTLKGHQLATQLDTKTTGKEVIVGIATPGISVWNPAFDVTPHDLIDAIVTEDPHVFEKDASGKYDLIA